MARKGDPELSERRVHLERCGDRSRSAVAEKPRPVDSEPGACRVLLDEVHFVTAVGSSKVEIQRINA